jgi:predicted Fe-Mo cluster-binding NifX family protein
MERIGIPTFESRLSPVLDACNRMVVVDIEDDREIKRQELNLEKTDLNGRIEIFAHWGIQKIICCGVSDLMCRCLAAKSIVLISGIAGELENVVNACICNRLDDECFSMPGKSSQKENLGEH